MFGKKPSRKGKYNSVIPYYGEERPYLGNIQPTRPAVCQICGCEYCASTTSSARSYNACDDCNAIYLKERKNVPQSMMPVARSYQYDFGCYAKYEAILTLYSDRAITFEERQQKIADLVDEYKQKQAQVDAREQSRRQKELEQKAANHQRLRDMHGI